MVLEYVVAEPWLTMKCCACPQRYSIPALGKQRNLAPVFCACGAWFAWPTGNLIPWGGSFLDSVVRRFMER